MTDMHLDLIDTEIDELLRRQLYGHLGCMLPDQRVYVVPITYAYHDGAVYSFSYRGQKIDALRTNPSTCFQTEEFVNEGAWRSVIAWGTYEELSGDQQFPAAKMLFDRLEREHGMAVSPLYQPPARVLFPAVSRALKEKEAVFYRIRIEQKTGRYIQYD